MLSVILISLSLVGILFTISYVFIVWWIALIVFIIGILSLIGFVIRQNHISDPLINLKPLKNKAFTLSVILIMLCLTIIFAFNVLLSQYLQSELGIEPLYASLTLFPAIFLSCIISPIAGRLYDKYGAKWLLITGYCLITVFAVLLALFINSPSLILVGALFVPIILGSALIIGPVQSYGLSSLKPEENPHGVTIFSTGFQIAGCLGASLFANVYSSLMQINNNSAFLIVGIIIAICSIFGLILSIILNRIKKNLKLAQTENVEEFKIKIPTLREIMKTEVYSVDANASISDVMNLFITKKISGCPIVENKNKLVGYISDGDIVRFLSKNETTFKSVYTYNLIDGSAGEFDSKMIELLNLKAIDVASKDMFWVDINQDLAEVCKVLADMHKKKVPVMENGVLVGVITRSDITKYLMKFSVEQMKKLLKKVKI